MPNLDNIMPSDMRAAIEMDDLDKALQSLRTIGGITEGDVAAQVFDGDTTLGDATKAPTSKRASARLSSGTTPNAPTRSKATSRPATCERQENKHDQQRTHPNPAHDAAP
jgi:hypothetical protein